MGNADDAVAGVLEEVAETLVIRWWVARGLITSLSEKENTRSGASHELDWTEA